ncbi:class F sortase [uncultured Serinicoccus sp.]|uniref:class F sortase n=1 Tax=uncultured Serinicoccus sp. TaxID=735514 RepID=UPI0026281634|nr:class F sortase [uncultured Serinicoccus sp.]
MSTEQPGQGRRGAILTALAVLAVVVGVVVLAVGIGTQRPDPPSPPAATSAAEPTESSAAGPDDEGSSTMDAAEGSSTTDAAEGSSTTDAPEAGPTSTASEQQESPGPEVAALAPSEPVEVRLPSIDVTSPLHPLGLADDGTLQVPSGDRYHEAAWYDGSPTPGEIGPTVIEGHVTGAGGVESVFFELGALRPGDTAEVDREDGRTVTYEVYRVDQFPKDAFPTVDVYGPTDVPELRLITCGGEFDEQEQSHVDNTVVYARMIEG